MNKNTDELPPTKITQSTFHSRRKSPRLLSGSLILDLPDILTKNFIPFLRAFPRVRIALIAFLCFFLLSALICKLFFADYFEKFNALSNDGLFVTIILCAILLFYTFISFTKFNFNEPFSLNLERIWEEREKLQLQISSDQNEVSSEKDIFYTVQLNINRLDEYYTINIRQSYRSFNMSIFLIIAGFITLIAGFWIFYFDENRNITMAVVSGVSSIIMEFIGGTCFYIYNKTTKQLNNFYDRLVIAQDTMLAIKLCDQIEPQEKQHDVRRQIIVSLLGRCRSI
ncbi:MAG: hypothetical protein F8N36_08180 [Desulfovibrio sp.]|uniref:TRADD-N-associated membrane domain-containing protein n=1 Tax=Desulfovibrio sp. TaxID=885 RepID=UPI00135E2E67|nr:hypothetical protein [Desulfovibrio sp.]MTJ92824.1 hypothetical protein [Desulfovibrio sp.]